MLIRQYWRSKATIVSFLIALLIVLGHLISNLSYDANGGKQTVGFFFFSPYMNWLPVDISSNLPIVWTFVAPLLSVLAGGMFAAVQGRNGFNRLMRSRQSFWQYRRGILLAAGFWGALLPLLVLGIDFLGLLMIHPNVLPNVWLNNNVLISQLGLWGDAFYNHTWFYMLGWSVLVAAYGASYAILSNCLYFITKKAPIALLGVIGLQLLLLGISLSLNISLAPIGYLQIVPIVGQPVATYVIFWPLVIVIISIGLSLKLPKVER